MYSPSLGIHQSEDDSPKKHTTGCGILDCASSLPTVSVPLMTLDEESQPANTEKCAPRELVCLLPRARVFLITASPGWAQPPCPDTTSPKNDHQERTTRELQNTRQQSSWSASSQHGTKIHTLPERSRQHFSINPCAHQSRGTTSLCHLPSLSQSA